MKLRDLPIGSVVEFTSAINAFGAYAEQGIRASIAAIEQRDAETLYVQFMYAPFVLHNQAVETANYGRAPDLKTATQAGVVPPSEGLFFSLETAASEFVQVVALDQAPSAPVPPSTPKPRTP